MPREQRAKPAWLLRRVHDDTLMIPYKILCLAARAKKNIAATLRAFKVLPVRVGAINEQDVGRRWKVPNTFRRNVCPPPNQHLVLEAELRYKSVGLAWAIVPQELNKSSNLPH